MLSELAHASFLTKGMLPGMTIYLDHAATTWMYPEVVDVMATVQKNVYGNPSSLHDTGRQAKKLLDGARAAIAQAISAESPDDIILTSGATEANNLATIGLAFGSVNKGRHIITTAIEHPSVYEPLLWLKEHGWEITFIPVDGDGFIDLNTLGKSIRHDTVLVSVIHGNNEIGTIQNMNNVAAITRGLNVLLHTDATQTMGKLPIHVKVPHVDLLSCSAHKFHGPKGAGFLYANARAREFIKPIIHGGSHEQGFRAGTESIADIVGMAKALEISLSRSKDETTRLRNMAEKLIYHIKESIPGVILNGPRDVHQRVPGNVNISFSPLEGESIVLRLDMQGIHVSSGSACHTSQLRGSHVVYALSGDEARAKSSIRFSFGPDNTEQDIDYVVRVLPEVLERAGYFRHHAGGKTTMAQETLESLLS